MIFFTALAVVVLDQVTKQLIKGMLPLQESIAIIPGFFRITHIENTGAAFGLFAGDFPFRGLLLIIFSLVALVFIFYLLRKWPRHWMVRLPLGLILGGALGNLWDRVHLGRVVDFIEVGYYQWTWPVFNVADSAISVGVCMLLIYFWKSPQSGLQDGTLKGSD